MKSTTVLIGLLAALGGCSLLDRATGAEALCRASDLESDLGLERMPDQSVVVTICEAGRTSTRDARGRAYVREWRETISCDATSLAEAPRTASVRSCLGGR